MRNNSLKMPIPRKDEDWPLNQDKTNEGNTDDEERCDLPKLPSDPVP
jgi:hypothetical protein